MKIVLLNNNPVVEKLVTLSAQKIGSEISVMKELDEIEGLACDLLIVDDASYDAENFGAQKEKIEYKKSLYIYGKDAEAVEGFDLRIKKPFLPTDLVELLSNTAIQVKGEPAPTKTVEESVEEEPENDAIESLENIDLDTFDLGELGNEIDALDTADFEQSLEQDLKEDEAPEEETTPVLDQDDVKEVQQLLEDTEKDGSETGDQEDVLEMAEEPEQEAQTLEQTEVSEMDAFDDETPEEISVEEGVEELDLSDSPVQEELDTGEDIEEPQTEKEALSMEDITQEEALAEDDGSLEEIPAEEGVEALDLGDFPVEEKPDTAEDIEELTLDGLDVEDEVSPEEIEESLENEELQDGADENLLDEEMLLENESGEPEENLKGEEGELEDMKLDESDDNSFEEMEDLKTLDTEDVAEEIAIEESLDMIDANIESELSKLSADDLEGELPEDALDDLEDIEMTDGEIEELSELDETALREAVGEAPVSETHAEEIPDEDMPEVAAEEFMNESKEEVLETESQKNGTEALKALLEALNNEEIAASLDGMNININITIGASK
jgi:uncharacterized membrane protein